MSGDTDHDDPDPDGERARAGEPAADEPEPMPVDASALKALAHPLRVRMYDLLADGGPATASQLAEQVGESSGTTSYHLRFLARHGFIEEDTDRGGRRERWWRTRPGGFTLQAQQFLDDPDASSDLEVVGRELWRSYARQLDRWFRSATGWGQEWISSSVSTTSRMVAAPDELRALREELLAVVARHQQQLSERTPPPGAARVMAQIHLFPIEPVEQGDRADADGQDV